MGVKRGLLFTYKTSPSKSLLFLTQSLLMILKFFILKKHFHGNLREILLILDSNHYKTVWLFCVIVNQTLLQVAYCTCVLISSFT